MNLVGVATGKGCDHCVVGRPITYVENRGGRKLSLCLECTMWWFPGRDITWWEDRHQPFKDHVREALKRAGAAELERCYQAMSKVERKKVAA